MERLPEDQQRGQPRNQDNGVLIFIKLDGFGFRGALWGPPSMAIAVLVRLGFPLPLAAMLRDFYSKCKLCLRFTPAPG